MVAKMVVDKNDFNRQCFHDEVGLMLLNKNDSIIQCYDSMESMGKLWAFLERMEGDMEHIINYCAESHDYDENFIRYVLYRVLQGLKYLHENNIMHRDIKK